MMVRRRRFRPESPGAPDILPSDPLPSATVPVAVSIPVVPAPERLGPRSGSTPAAVVDLYLYDHRRLLLPAPVVAAPARAVVAAVAGTAMGLLPVWSRRVPVLVLLVEAVDVVVVADIR